MPRLTNDPGKSVVESQRGRRPIGAAHIYTEEDVACVACHRSESSRGSIGIEARESFESLFDRPINPSTGRTTIFSLPIFSFVETDKRGGPRKRKLVGSRVWISRLCGRRDRPVCSVISRNSGSEKRSKVFSLLFFLFLSFFFFSATAPRISRGKFTFPRYSADPIGIQSSERLWRVAVLIDGWQRPNKPNRDKKIKE